MQLNEGETGKKYEVQEMHLALGDRASAGSSRHDLQDSHRYDE